MKLRYLMTAVAAGMISCAMPAHATTNLLTNGSFETGDFTGWTVSTTGQGQQGYSAPVVIQYGSTAGYPNGAYGEAITADSIGAGSKSPDAAGSYTLYLSSDVGTQSLSQTVSLIAGHSYAFGFDYYLPANGYSNPNDATLSASMNGTTFASFDLGAQTAQTWATVSQTASFTAASTGAFTFNFAGDGYPAKDVAIDRVYLLDTTSVPEPATWGMMIIGFGAIGFMARRRSFALS